MQAQLDASMAEQGLLPIIHHEAFYGNPADVPDRPVVFAGVHFRVPSSAVGSLPLFTRDLAAGCALPCLLSPHCTSCSLHSSRL